MKCVSKPGPLTRKINKLTKDLKKCQQCASRVNCLLDAIVASTPKILTTFPSGSNITLHNIFNGLDIDSCSGMTISYGISLTSLTNSAPYLRSAATADSLFSLSEIPDGYVVAYVGAVFTLPATSSCPQIQKDVRLSTTFLIVSL